jgi:hypothetical protein
MPMFKYNELDCGCLQMAECKHFSCVVVRHCDLHTEDERRAAFTRVVERFVVPGAFLIIMVAGVVAVSVLCFT